MAANECFELLYQCLVVIQLLHSSKWNWGCYLSSSISVYFYWDSWLRMYFQTLKTTLESSLILPYLSGQKLLKNYKMLFFLNASFSSDKQWKSMTSNWYSSGIASTIQENGSIVKLNNSFFSWKLWNRL